jgi:threonine dehydrogenase-like Zn-dependent dehydrogenase
VRALVYGIPRAIPAAAPASLDDPAVATILAQPFGLHDLDQPVVGSDEGVVIAPRLVGICGSDARLMLGDLSEGDMDNPMASFSQLPFVPGHEVVADVVEAGPSSGFEPGERVVLNPWMSCAPRGLVPCASCRQGNLAQCERFLDAGIGPGLHIGVTAGAPGAFAERLAVHGSQLHRVAPGVGDAAAVLADPFSVSLHAIMRRPPPPDGRALVIGQGALGTTAVAVLRRWHPNVAVGVVTRFDHQAAAAARLGGDLVVAHEPRAQTLESLASWSQADLHPSLVGLPMSYPGGVDVVYDTVGSAETLELAVRIVKVRGDIVLLGVATPRRFEWTPIYFKELTVTGSSGFGVESIDGHRAHAIDHYLATCEQGLDLSWLVTHVAPLERWLELCVSLAEPARSGVIKAAFTPNG